MKLLLTSSGISNASILGALVELLGKPIAEANALVVPTAILPFSSGPQLAARLIRGEVSTPLTDLGWGSLGMLELTALPSINEDVWVPTVQATDALLFWGGDPLYLSYWMQQSGLTELLPTLTSVYVGTSAGAMAAASTFGETYVEPPGGSSSPLSSDEMLFATPDGDVSRTFVTAAGAGLVEFAVIPHLDNPNHPDASLANAERWAGRLPVPTYAIDDQTALKVTDGVVDVVSEGTWRLFPPT
ncbi:MAG: Type 1 glutamine amidotransferase-like domain-containing protein [Actinobacteria bacterium]|nr:Type 1 glutamine amidotransferase-like domain-containing protein [Actinomycetota bacterium]